MAHGSTLDSFRAYRSSATGYSPEWEKRGRTITTLNWPSSRDAITWLGPTVAFMRHSPGSAPCCPFPKTHVTGPKLERSLPVMPTKAFYVGHSAYMSTKCKW